MRGFDNTILYFVPRKGELKVTEVLPLRRYNLRTLRREIFHQTVIQVLLGLGILFVVCPTLAPGLGLENVPGGFLLFGGQYEVIKVHALLD